MARRVIREYVDDTPGVVVDDVGPGYRRGYGPGPDPGFFVNPIVAVLVVVAVLLLVLFLIVGPMGSRGGGGGTSTRGGGGVSVHGNR